MDAVDEQQEQTNAERGENTAENVRYGQNISEGGMGEMTTEGQGGGNQGMSRVLDLVAHSLCRFSSDNSLCRRRFRWNRGAK